MDIFILAPLIKELVLENGRAVLPGFGVFSTEPLNASFSEEGRIINPPTKRIVFREDAAINDDLLLERFALKMNESADSLRPRLESIVREMMDEAINRGSMAFAGFGTLTYHPGGTFSFQPEDGKDFFMEMNGMEPIQLRIIESTVIPDTEPAAGPETGQEPISDPLPEPILGAAEEAGPESTGEEPESEHIPITEHLPEPIQETVDKPQPAPQTEMPDKNEPPAVEDRSFRLRMTIIIVLSVIILGSVFVILGRNGAFDRILYSDEELELIESQSRDIE